MPWRSTSTCLPNNKSVAEHRLKLLQKRLIKNEDLRKKYTDFIEDLFVKRYAERVPSSELKRTDGRLWSLPHHSVVNPHKPDKTRVVFDCAATYKGTSLNSQVLQGPDLANNLVGVLMRFRENPVALMADIEAMFLQIKVCPGDVDALRFLWFPGNDVRQEPVECRMLVHLFGGVWSPSCANFALRKTAEDHSSEFEEEVISTVEKNFYVDDCLKSVETEGQAIEADEAINHVAVPGWV